MQDGKAKQRINWGQAFAEVILIFVGELVLKKVDDVNELIQESLQ